MPGLPRVTPAISDGFGSSILILERDMHAERRSLGEIALSLNMGKSTVREYVERGRAAGLSLMSKRLALPWRFWKPLRRLKSAAGGVVDIPAPSRDAASVLPRLPGQREPRSGGGREAGYGRHPRSLAVKTGDSLC